SLSPRVFPVLTSVIQSSPAPEPKEIGTFGTRGGTVARSYSLGRRLRVPVHFLGSSGWSHLGTGLLSFTGFPFSNTAATRYGVLRSSLSKTQTEGISRMAALRLVIVRGKRANSFSVGTSCPPWLTRMATR